MKNKISIFDVNTHEEYLLNKDVININEQNNFKSALLDALSKDQSDKAKWLIEEGASKTISEFSHINATPELQLLMIKHGIDVHEKTLTSENMLFYALDDKVVKELLKKGLDIHDINYDGQNALFLNASADNTKTIKYLIEKGIKVDKRDNSGRTPLFYASYHCMEILLKNGAQVDVKDNEMLTPLMTIISKEEMDLLIEYGANVNHVDNAGENILMLIPGELINLDLCLSKGLNINHRDNAGNNALFHLRENAEGDINLGKELIQRGIEYGEQFFCLPYELQDFIVMLEEKNKLMTEIRVQATKNKTKSRI